MLSTLNVHYWTGRGGMVAVVSGNAQVIITNYHSNLATVARSSGVFPLS